MSSYLIWSLWSFVKVGSIVEEATRIGNSGAKSREEELKEVPAPMVTAVPAAEDAVVRLGLGDT